MTPRVALGLDFGWRCQKKKWMVDDDNYHRSSIINHHRWWAHESSFLPSSLPLWYHTSSVPYTADTSYHKSDTVYWLSLGGKKYWVSKIPRWRWWEVDLFLDYGLSKWMRFPSSSADFLTGPRWWWCKVYLTSDCQYQFWTSQGESGCSEAARRLKQQHKWIAITLLLNTLIDRINYYYQQLLQNTIMPKQSRRNKAYSATRKIYTYLSAFLVARSIAEGHDVVDLADPDPITSSFLRASCRLKRIKKSRYFVSRGSYRKSASQKIFEEDLHVSEEWRWNALVEWRWVQEKVCFCFFCFLYMK